MRARTWSAEVYRLVGVYAIALGLGLLTSQFAWCLFIATAAYLLWQQRQLYRLYRWLSGGKGGNRPDASGVWGAIIDRVYRVQLRNRKRKKQLSRLLKRFQQSSAALPDATVVLGPQQEIEALNDAARRLLGLNSSTDLGQRITNLIRHPSFARYLVRADYSEAVELPSPVDDEIFLSVRLVPYGKGQFLLSARDVTRVHQLEQMRRDFVANVSHELRTPLTVISGYLETLQEDGDHYSFELKASLSQMMEQAARMGRIIDDLLMLSRLESGEAPASEPAKVSVPGILAAIEEDARLLSGADKRNIVLQVDSSLWLKGCPAELHSAFSNLVTNAVRYTPAEGTIALRWYADDDGAHFEVSDTGIGIESHHLPRLTERFYRVGTDRSRSTGGTGLGLSIVKHVLQRHDATLRIESEPGKGSKFTCDFPCERIVRRESVQIDQAASA